MESITVWSAVLLISLFVTTLNATEIQLAQCGGEIDADSDTIEYPAVGDQLIPGQVCVWTIHLNTKRNFRFDFFRFNVNSTDDNCNDAGIRLYSLTNLIPEGETEGYSFCNAKPPSDSFYLGNAVAVLIAYSKIGNPTPGSGFRVSFSGLNDDVFRTQHISSFSTALEGAIMYPVAGAYGPNIAATWLIKTMSPTQGSRSDLTLSKVTLEPCGNPQDACSCDALLFFEVGLDGELTETRRLCQDETNFLLSNIESIFIVALFTDFDSYDSPDGTGFSLIYQPTREETSPTPTTLSTTTVEPSTTTVPTTTEQIPTPTACGSTIESDNGGFIMYKAEQLYSANERCVFTVRIPRAQGITFNLLQSGISESDLDDGISISSFSRVDPPLVQTEFLRTEGQRVNLTGSVATVTFITDSDVQGMGFIMEYRATYFSNPVISPLSLDFISSSSTGAITYPGNGENYDNYELSTFIIATPEFSVNSSPRMNVTWTSLGLEGSCYDFVVLYKFYPDPNAFGGWSQFDTYCATSPRATTHTDLMLYVFKSDSTGNSTGFKFDWFNVNA